MKGPCSWTFIERPSTASSPFTMPILRETPPVKVISSSTPTRRTSAMVRVAMALWTPPRMSSTVFRWAR